jgi:hypothetical protein
MKKVAFPVLSLILLVLIVVISQMACCVNANPDWRPWENALSHPIITVFSPVENQSCTSSEVVLNFTVTKPEDWLDSKVQIRYISYCVDGFIDGIAGENETVIEVRGPVDAENSSFSFSFNLVGLNDGPHWLDIYAEGFESGSVMGTTKRIHFTTHTLEAANQLYSYKKSIIITSVIIIAIISGLLVYFKKRKH